MDADHAPVVAMRPAHVAACAALVGRTPFFQQWGLTAEATRRQLEQALDEPRYELAVWDDGDGARGFAWIVPRGAFDRSAYLRLLAVAPEHHGRGIGRALVAWFEARYPDRGAALLVTESNTAARRFYAALGYREVGALPDYVRPGVTECLLYKPARAAR